MDLIETSPGPRHPWETSRAAFFQSILRRALGGRGPIDVLDCGAGDAWFSTSLKRTLDVRSLTCWDAYYDEATIARLSKEHPEVTFTREMPRRQFDLILMLDVIEHVEDDLAFVRGAVESCTKPDGIVLVSVPAWQKLFSRHDEFLRHFRRYSPEQCDRVLRASGLRIEERGGAFHGLVLPRAAAVVGERIARAVRGPLPPIEQSSVTWRAGAAVTAVVSGALRLDNALSHLATRAGVNVPGLSYWALTRPDPQPR